MNNNTCSHTRSNNNCSSSNNNKISNDRKRSRWGRHGNNNGSGSNRQRDSSLSGSSGTTTGVVITDQEALEDLLRTANQNAHQTNQRQSSNNNFNRNRNFNHRNNNSTSSSSNDNRNNNNPNNHLEKYQNPHDRNNNSNNNKNNNNRSSNNSVKRQRTSTADTTAATTTTTMKEEKESKKKDAIAKPNFGLSGALARDQDKGNMYKGVLLKFKEPADARAPNTQWRLYVFKDDKNVETLHISKQSAYLVGRNTDICDIPVHHSSCSSQHAVIQYRAVPVKTADSGLIPQTTAPPRLHCQPYLLDLESTNGTFINGTQLEAARYYQLKKGDVIKFGASTREYVLLTQNTTSVTTSK